MIRAWAVAISLTGCVAPLLTAQSAGTQPAPAVRNPSFLHAREPLTRRDLATPRRARFEWEQVGAAEYVLQGQWMEPGSWAARRREMSVTHQSAAAWDDRLVAVELPLEVGAHSWSIVAVFPGRSPGDFAHPTRVSFEVR